MNRIDGHSMRRARRKRTRRNQRALPIGSKAPPMIRALQSIIGETSATGKRHIAMGATIFLGDNVTGKRAIENHLRAQRLHRHRGSRNITRKSDWIPFPSGLELKTRRSGHNKELTADPSAPRLFPSEFEHLARSDKRSLRHNSGFGPKIGRSGVSGYLE